MFGETWTERLRKFAKDASAEGERIGAVTELRQVWIVGDGLLAEGA